MQKLKHTRLLAAGKLAGTGTNVGSTHGCYGAITRCDGRRERVEKKPGRENRGRLFGTL